MWLLIIFYLPSASFVLWQLWRHLPKSLPIRVAGVFFSACIATAIPLGDVFSTSLKMVELCPKAGIFVKRSVRVEGFFTDFGSPDQLKRGFRYVESRGPGDRIRLYTKDGDSVQKTEFDAKQYQVKSRYEFIHDAELGSYEGRRDIGIQKSVVRDRETGEELGYTLRYSIFPGWVDRNTIGLFGMIGWKCDAHVDQTIFLLKQVLLPEQSGLR